MSRGTVVTCWLQSAESGQPPARSQTPGFDPKPSLTGTEQPRGQIEFSLTWLLCMPQATHHLGAANYAMVGQALLGVDMRATPLLSRGDSSSGGSK